MHKGWKSRFKKEEEEKPGCECLERYADASLLVWTQEQYFGLSPGSLQVSHQLDSRLE
jgi:hypothetical protein